MKLKIAIVQCSMHKEEQKNCDKLIGLLFEAKKLGAQVVLMPELFLSHYFCKNQDDQYFSLAHELDSHPFLPQMQKVCAQLAICLPFSFYEKSGPSYYNSVAMIDSDGSILGVYRKSHIPDGPGYQEKFYFRPGNTGFKVFNTKYGNIGVGICWDQWFPEAARIMTLEGADILLYPTAIGSEPNNPSLNTKDAWQRVMIGHAVANMIPVAAANRVGIEEGQSFYGASFVCNELGDKLTCLENEEAIRVVEVDLTKAAKSRSSFGFFRDRRTDLYKKLLE